MAKLKNLKGVAHDVSGALRWQLPALANTEKVFFKINLLTGQITPEEVVTESLVKAIDRAIGVLFHSSEKVCGVKSQDIQEAVMEVKGSVKGRYNITTIIKVNGKEYTGSD
jgi:hypothetical protein